MHNVPAEILNKIAELPMHSRAVKTLFRMDDAQKAASLDDQYRKLVASGVETTVALAYQTVAPLWLENVAISRHIVRTGKSDLRYLLPEVTSLAEALDLAEREWMLDPAQLLQLRRLLNALPDASPTS